MKVLNEDYVRYEHQPLDITLRNKIGISLEKDEINQLNDAIKRLLESDSAYYKDQIQKLVDTYVFHIGESGKIGGQYIIDKIMEKRHKYDY